MNMRFRNHAVFPHFLFNLAIFINSKTGVSGLTRFGETLTYSAIRQVHEETGLQIRITGLIGTCTDPHILTAWSDGEVMDGRESTALRRPQGFSNGRLFPQNKSSGLPTVCYLRCHRYKPAR